jgi:hypothetical protein
VEKSDLSVLNERIRKAISEAMPDASPRKIAESIAAIQDQVIDRLKIAWFIQRLTRSVRRQQVQEHDTRQLNFAGYERVPATIKVNGKQLSVMHATFTVLKEMRKALKRRFEHGPQFEQFNALYAVMDRQHKKHPGITVEEALTLETKRMGKHQTVAAG